MRAGKPAEATQQTELFPQSCNQMQCSNRHGRLEYSAHYFSCIMWSKIPNWLNHQQPKHRVAPHEQFLQTRLWKVDIIHQIVNPIQNINCRLDTVICQIIHSHCLCFGKYCFWGVQLYTHQKLLLFTQATRKTCILCVFPESISGAVYLDLFETCQFYRRWRLRQVVNGLQFSL